MGDCAKLDDYTAYMVRLICLLVTQLQMGKTGTEPKNKREVRHNNSQSLNLIAMVTRLVIVKFLNNVLTALPGSSD